MTESVFEQMSSGEHEQVLFCHEPHLGLKAIIAIHDTRLGPALGGCRIRNYASEAEALRDVLRLSRAMTYKAAIAGLDLGGGKSVILGDPSIRSEALMRAFGRHVHSLGGRYVVAEDMNSTAREMLWIGRETPYVTGRPEAWGGLGEPGHVTAFGVYQGIRAALLKATGSTEVRGRKVAVQGLGSVGLHLTQRLVQAGARVWVSDIDRARVAQVVEDLGVEPVAPEAYLSTPCDVLAPCAIGGILNAQSIETLKTEIIVGSANNVLGDEVADAERLRDRGILYAPDYVVNAGGLIAMYAEWTQGTLARAISDTEHIFDTTCEVFSRADAKRCTTSAAAAAIAQERIERVMQTRAFYAPASRPVHGPPSVR